MGLADESTRRVGPFAFSLGQWVGAKSRASTVRCLGWVRPRGVRPWGVSLGARTGWLHMDEGEGRLRGTCSRGCEMRGSGEGAMYAR